LKIKRVVEMYQWVEAEAEATTEEGPIYKYTRQWRNEIVDSKSFQRDDDNNSPSQ